MQVLRRMILRFVGITVSFAGGFSPAWAQNLVTPTVKPTPPGNFIIVNNSPANNAGAHVSGDLVCYTTLSGGSVTVHYFNLATQTDAVVPQPSSGLQDLRCDVRGSTITFIRVWPTPDSASPCGQKVAVLALDVSAGGPPVEIAPLADSCRVETNIGDQAIAWGEAFGPLASDTRIVAFNRADGSTQILTPPTVPPMTEDLPAVSPDGSVVVYDRCSNASFSSCAVWSATRSNSTWTAQQLPSQTQGDETYPDTDGTIITYGSNYLTNGIAGDHLVWQPVGGGTEQVLNFAGHALWPAVDSKIIAFAGQGPTDPGYQIAVYDVANNVLYNVQADLTAAGLFPQIQGTTSESQIPDISVTPDGKVRVVWDTEYFSSTLISSSIYAYTFNLPVGDFNFSAISPVTIAGGSSMSANVTVNPVNGFSSAVNLSVTGQPAGVSAQLSTNTVTPSGGNSATSVLNVSVADFVTPTNFTLTVTGTSGSLSHSVTADVTVTATTTSIGNLIGDLLNAGCIDNAGIGNALMSKLSAAQSAAAAGNVQAAINTLTALKNQINGQAGKHIATACTIGGVALNPVTVLLLDVQGLIDSLRVSLTPDPLTGYVVDGNGVGVPGVQVSILDASASAVIATATTDITGFYFFATTGGVLNSGVNYTLQLNSVPGPFSSVMPATQPFQWQGTTGIAFANFLLN